MPDARFYELYDRPSADSDGRWLRGFRVPADTEAAALNYNAADPTFPKTGDAHPRNPLLTCTRVFVAGRHGTDSWEVFAEYSPPGFSFNPSPPPDTTAPGTKWFSGSVTFRPLAIPYFRKVSLAVPGVGVTGSLVYKWSAERLEPIDFSVQQSVHQVVVNVPTFNVNDEAIIAANQNKIHTIGTRKYLFTGASWDQERADSVTIRYEWVYEGETNLRPIFQGLPAIDYILPPDTLPAYHGFIVTSQQFPDLPPTSFSTIPKIETALMYEEVPGGHAQLPGGPTQ